MATENEQFHAAAENFIKTIWNSDVIVNQKNLDVITAEMNKLGISRINEAAFHAGLFAARSQGLLELKEPIPSAHTSPAPAPAQETVAPTELKGTRGERLALIGIKTDSAHPTAEDRKQEAVKAAENAQKRRRTEEQIRKFLQSKLKADPITVYRKDGRIDWTATDNLRKGQRQ